MTALTSIATSPATLRYTTMRDSTDPVVIRNIEWLQAARRRPLSPRTLTEKIRWMAATPIPLGQLLHQTSATYQDLLRLVWHGSLQLELASTLSDETAVWAS
ncbi:hypothetical protein [Agrococcus sp. ARC_14]|uniref:hypothetical protein n=1 Tax=Agrococcus sp. ARC_14 TaxID=2919927 RepID=UPI001F05510E|nr:hypothetical protein [Agrococcus sp. ARC_14]MCH1882861.1 hypothetical protein [Agrococcus sp. ARC_14]